MTTPAAVNGPTAWPLPPAALAAVVREGIEAIRRAARIVITSHPKPDGDAIGSSLGLARSLQAAGKSVCVAGLHPLPRRYADLARAAEIQDVDTALGQTPDLLIALDAASADRLPEGFEGIQDRMSLLNIDHHADNTRFGRINLVDDGASSTGEMVCYVARAGRYPLTVESATPLWVAMVTDTGRFSHANTTPRAMQTAACLLTHGVPTAEWDRRMYGLMTRSELELQRRVLQSLEFHGAAGVVFATLGAADFAAAACGPEQIGDLIEIPRAVEGVDVAVLFYEHESRPGIHVSMRSNTEWDVSAVCRTLGGGGHARAAGCTLSMDMASAQACIRDQLAQGPPRPGGTGA